MARIRTIKPDFFKNEQVAELPPIIRLFFIGLWTQADRDGKLEDRPKRLKVELLPYDDDDIFDVNSALSLLYDKKLIHRYTCLVDGEKQNFIKILTFKKHQQPNVKEAVSIIPDPVNMQAPYEHSTDTVLASQEGKGKGTGREQEGKGTGKEGDRGRLRFSPPSFDDVFNFFNLKKTEPFWPEEKCRFQAKKFIDHYTSNGWMVGKNKMSKWKSAASGWVNRDLEFTQKNNFEKNGNTQQKSRIETIIDSATNYIESQYGPQ